MTLLTDGNRVESNGSKCKASSTSSKQKTIREQIKHYRRIDSLLSLRDESTEILRNFLQTRHNEELLQYLEACLAFKEFKKTREQQLVEFKLLHERFVNMESNTCINMPGELRERFQQARILIDRGDVNAWQQIAKSLDGLSLCVHLQFKNEIMPEFWKTKEMQTFLLEKLIELSSFDVTDQIKELNPGDSLIADFLVENELDEYRKIFSKKKLLIMEQIRFFTQEDFRDIGIKKIGHLKRIVRTVAEHFETTTAGQNKL